ncbi:MAG: hypothetical protein ACKPBG_08755 [Actinomycetota bacterium]
MNLFLHGATISQLCRPYQIEGTGTMIGGQAVIEPNLESKEMLAILAIFQGTAPLAFAPVQVDPATTDGPTTTVGSSSTTVATGVESNNVGILPIDDPACR